MIISKFLSKKQPIIASLIVLGFSYIFINFGIAISQENLTTNILVSKAEVLELAEKFIYQNQDKVSFLVSAKIGEPKLLYDENNNPTQWRVAILKGSKRLGSFNVLAYKSPDGVLPTWFYGPGDGNSRTIETADASRGLVKITPFDETKKNPDVAFAKETAITLQEREEDKSVSLPNKGAFTQENTLQLPNLAFYTPAGWDNNIIVSSVSGTHTHEETVPATFYIDYAYANYSDHWAFGRITQGIYVSDQELARYGRDDLAPWNYSYYEDHQATGIADGWHTIGVRIDMNDNIAESNEDDNWDEVYVYVEVPDPHQPTLTDHFTCRDPDNPHGTRTSTFYPSDWAACEYTVWNTWNCTRIWEGRCDFWDPNGEIYWQGNVDLEPGHTSIQVTFLIYINGHPAQNMLGGWRALVSLEGAYMAHDDFEIIDDGGDKPELGDIIFFDAWGNQKNTFRTTDPSVKCRTTWNTMNCTRSWGVEIGFFNPNNNEYDSGSGSLPPGHGSYIFEFEIQIAGQYPANNPGTWHASALLEGEWIDNAYFDIIREELGDIEVNPTSWDYGTVIVGQHSDRGFVVSNTGSGDLNVGSTQIMGTNASEFHIQSGGGSFTLGPGGTRTIMVRFSPTFAGNKNAYLRINSDDPDENPFDVNLRGTGQIQVQDPDIAVNPISWNYGSVQIGNYLDKDFVVSNTGAGNLNVSSTQILGTNASEFNIQSGGGAFNLGPGGTRAIIVRFSPSFEGNMSAILRFISNDPDENPLDVNLSGRGIRTQEPDWMVRITINSGATTITRTFGGDANATDGYDSGLDVQAAPPGMTYYAYFQISQFPNYLDTDIRRWISPYNVDIDWTLRIINATGQTSGLSWNTSNLPPEDTFTLEGSGLNVNMRNQSSVQINGDATLIIKYRHGAEVTYNFPSQGWYLISLPLYPDDNSLGSLFPTAMSAFAYNSNTMSYYSVTALEPKKGYWLSIPGPTSSTITGAPLNSYTENYNTGWHLIGSVLGTTNFTDPNDNPNGSIMSAWGWNPNTSQYFAVYPPGTGVLNEKEGYWLAVAQSCNLTIGSSLKFEKVVPANADVASFYKQYGSKPPVPPDVANPSVDQSLALKDVTLRSYPNPFNLETMIEYSILKPGLTRVYIFNALGQRIRTLLEIEQQVGTHQVVWDGRNDSGDLVNSGIYFCKIFTSNLVETRKLVLLK